MSHKNRLAYHLNELCPVLDLGSWNATEPALAERVNDFTQKAAQVASTQAEPTSPESAQLDRQARYLAEEICLDSFKPNRVAEGISQYLKHYVTENFPNDQLRTNLINQICQDANTNHATHQVTHHTTVQSNDLIKLLTNPPSTIPHVATVQQTVHQTTLQTMKDVQAPNRFGDVVFLPKDAQIIVIGDTHGDLASTQQIIQEIREKRAIEHGAFIVFLGDYAHNGVKSWRNLYEILTFQQAHPGAVILLNGNHEFRESYLTALNEYFRVHWDHFVPGESADELPGELQDRHPQNDNHYGHLRLDLIRSFGLEEGERIYSAFAEWGINLPYICISDNLMLSHSLGKLPEKNLTLPDLLHAKQQDAPHMRQLGYETWHAARPTLHSALSNNRHITADLANEFSNLLGVNQFVVGHCHYRSGDTVTLGGNSVTTVVSSSPYSPDSGHYMYQQMVVTRAKMREEENLAEGDAVACYLTFSDGKIRIIHLKHP